jgi:hypothetical protein
VTCTITNLLNNFSHCSVWWQNETSHSAGRRLWFRKRKKCSRKYFELRGIKCDI